MSTKFENETELTRAIGELPKAVAPRRDLWPGIDKRLTDRAEPENEAARSGGWRYQALAAAVVVAFAAGILTGRQWSVDAPVPESGPLSANRALMAAAQASEREYQAAFRQYIPVGSAQAVLGQQAVENIEQSWQELLQAEAALLEALEEHPENSYLNQRLLDLRSQQLAFMKQLATLDQFSRRKT